mgnify:CR=1 FL=1
MIPIGLKLQIAEPNDAREAKIARQRCPDVPFMFIVGLTEPRVTELALEKGAAAYLLKDEPHTLAPAVLAVLDKNQMARQR